MKRILIFFAFLYIPIIAFTQSAVNIDTALKQGVTYLNGRLQKGSKIIVLNFTSDWPKLTDYIIEELIGYIVNDGTLTVVDRANLETVRKELNFQLSGDVDDETAQSIGKILGAQTIISGGITAIGNAYRLRIRAISVQTAQVLGMQNVDIVHDSRIAGLTGIASASPVAVNATTTSVSYAKPIIASISPYIIWKTESGGEKPNIADSINVKYNGGSEYIDGQLKDVLTVEVDFSHGSGLKYGHIKLTEYNTIQNLRQANGVRFKVLGDGKTWRFQIVTKEILKGKEWGSYITQITTKKGKVVEFDIPYSKLKQAEFNTKKVPFSKEDITQLIIERNNFKKRRNWLFYHKDF